MNIHEVFTKTSPEEQQIIDQFEIGDESKQWLDSINKCAPTVGIYSFYGAIHDSIQLVSTIIEATKSKLVTHTEPEKRQSYWILPDGLLILCEASKHNKTAIHWLMRNDTEILGEILDKNNVDYARFSVMVKLGWCEFSVQGTEMNIVTNEWYKGYTGDIPKVTNKQKESIAKILEINNIKDEEQWKYTY